MKKVKIGYWLCTAVIIWIQGAGGIYDMTKAQPVLDVIRHLGYPDYFPVMLGIAKVLGVVAILTPRASTLREWAYAGFTFNFLSASIAHTMVGDETFAIVFPLALLAPLFGSYFLGQKLRAQAAAASSANLAGREPVPTCEAQ
jgi:hypothetical protein